MTLGQWVQHSLEDLDRRHLRRIPRVLEGAPEAHIVIDGQTVINFASNNYLGLATHPVLKKAAHDAVQKWGSGATASRLMGGTLALHRQLEKSLANFKGTSAALVFPSGYHANTGVLPTLVEEGDLFVLDRLCHASLVDGVRLSRARWRVFAHNDPTDLARVLRRYTAQRKWVVTESVFSMDGDVAPLSEIASVAGAHGAGLYVDEAHGTGVWGEGGRGLLMGQGGPMLLVMGTLSKALGSQGGFVAGDQTWMEWIQNKSRSFIYSTALNPAAVAAAQAALDLCRQADDRRQKIFKLAHDLREGLRALGFSKEAFLCSEGPIVPVVVGETEEALSLSSQLWSRGVFVPAVRPPTVPVGTARLRFSITADHSKKDIDHVLEALSSWKANVGV